MENANWEKLMMPLDAIDKAMGGIMEKLDALNPELPKTPEAAELALWKGYLEVVELSDKLTIAEDRLNALRRNVARIRIKQLEVGQQPEAKAVEEPTNSTAARETNCR